MYNEKAANMELKAARGNLLPNVSLAGNVFSNYNLNDKYENGGHIPLNTQLNNNFGQTAGVFIEIPLFNKYQTKAAVEIAKVNLTNAKLATQEAENGIVKSTQQLLNDFISAKQQYLLQTEALQQGELSYNAFEEKH